MTSSASNPPNDDIDIRKLERIARRHLNIARDQLAASEERVCIEAPPAAFWATMNRAWEALQRIECSRAKK
jgi:hypothetical protein